MLIQKKSAEKEKAKEHWGLPDVALFGEMTSHSFPRELYYWSCKLVLGKAKVMQMPVNSSSVLPGGRTPYYGLISLSCQESSLIGLGKSTNPRIRESVLASYRLPDYKTQ